MCSPISSKEAKAKEDDYRAEDDLRTITRAEEVRSDPKRMAGVSRIHRKQLGAMQRAGKVINGTGAKRRVRRGASQRA